MPYKILLVEDNEMNRDMLTKRLIRKGYEIIVAVDGEQGVTMTTEQMPDIILMDMSLPILDGWDASNKIKSNDQTKNIPIIALTAHAMTGDREKAIAAGCDDFETKPIEFTQLIEKIESWLAKAALNKR
jgi:CheY-like chemotaxis protein